MHWSRAGKAPDEKKQAAAHPLDGLNEEQKKVVKFGAGKAIVIAGAGAGKTRAMMHRVGYWGAKGVPLSRMFVTTFTKNASTEMHARMKAMVGDSADKIVLGTFHSIGYSFIREFHGKKDVLTPNRRKVLIGQCAKGVGVDNVAVETIAGTISAAKLRFLDPAGLEESYEELGAGEYVPAVYREYENEKLRLDLVDYDDMLFQPWKLFNGDSAILEMVRKRYDFLMVDEAQDLNSLQIELAMQISGGHGNLMMVCDPDQAIYQWRGARPDLMIEFAKSNDVSVLNLSRNYRSTSTIVGASNKLIEHNVNRLDKTVFTERGAGKGIDLLVSQTQDDEAESLVRFVEVGVGSEGKQYGDFAVLYRTNAQGRAFEDALLQAGIPYVVFGSTGFYNRKEILDVLAYLRLAIDPEDNESLLRIANIPTRMLGAKWREEVLTLAKKNSAYSVLGERFSQSYMQKMSFALKQDIDSLHAMHKANAGPARIIEEILKLRSTGRKKETLVDHYRVDIDENTEDNRRVDNVLELRSAARRHESIEEFLDFVDRSKAASERALRKKKSNVVSLMTIHKSKGLEYDVVFVAGVSEGLLPHKMAGDDIEEERRLMYVAATRAANELHLSFLANRFGTALDPSRFLVEMQASVAESTDA